MIPGSRPVQPCPTEADHRWDDITTVHGKIAKLCDRCGAYEMHPDADSAAPARPSLEELAEQAARMRGGP